MSRSIRISTAVTLSAALAMGLAACAPGGGSAGQNEIVIILGATQGAPFIGPSLIDPYLSDLNGNGDRLTLIVADGEPFVVGDWVLGDLPEHPDDLSDALDEVRAEIVLTASTAAAKTAEVDMTEAIALATRSFTAEADSRTLVLAAPMIQTTGALDLTKGRFDLSAEELVDYAIESGGPVDLSGVAVKAPRLGLVEAPQPVLTAQAIAHLEQIWSTYFSQANAAGVDLSVTSLQQRAQDTPELPPVTPISIDRVVAECAVALDATAIRFPVRSAVFADAAAPAAIAQAVEKLSACTGDYLVEGSASSEGDPADNLSLSGERGTTVASEVGKILGISAAAIRVVPWGIDWPCRVNDLDENGALSETAAIANRVVVISRGLEPGTC